jgi:ABC-2 type transport system permease protein
MVALVLGASFIGAEWNHGSMAALLTWEPRRLRVYGGKLAGLWLGSIAIGAFVFAVALGFNYLAANRFGQIGQLTGTLQRELLVDTGRGIALALVGGAVGFAIAYATRLSSAALGVGLGYAVVGEIGVRLVNPHAERWLVSNNVNAWLNNGTMISDSGLLTGWQGGLYLGAIALALLIVSATLFARRDVT